MQLHCILLAVQLLANKNKQPPEREAVF